MARSNAIGERRPPAAPRPANGFSRPLSTLAAIDRGRSRPSGREAETEARGPPAVEALRALDAHFAFAIELVTARRTAKMTQTRLAEVSGVPQSEISRFERGQGNPTLETMGRLLGALGRRVASAPRAA